MGRVTGNELKEIITTSKSDDLLESQFIKTANIFVNTHLLSAGHSDDVLGRIELYLAAHFLALTEEGGGLVAERYGDASQRFADVYKEGGLNMTRFGQQAVILDTSGVLAAYAAPKKRAEFRVI